MRTAPATSAGAAATSEWSVTPGSCTIRSRPLASKLPVPSTRPTRARRVRQGGVGGAEASHHVADDHPHLGIDPAGVDEEHLVVDPEGLHLVELQRGRARGAVQRDLDRDPEPPEVAGVRAGAGSADQPAVVHAEMELDGQDARQAEGETVATPRDLAGLEGSAHPDEQAAQIQVEDRDVEGHVQLVLGHRIRARHGRARVDGIRGEGADAVAQAVRVEGAEDRVHGQAGPAGLGVDSRQRGCGVESGERTLHQEPHTLQRGALSTEQRIGPDREVGHLQPTQQLEGVAAVPAGEGEVRRVGPRATHRDHLGDGVDRGGCPDDGGRRVAVAQQRDAARIVPAGAPPTARPARPLPRGPAARGRRPPGSAPARTTGRCPPAASAAGCRW